MLLIQDYKDCSVEGVSLVILKKQQEFQQSKPLIKTQSPHRIVNLLRTEYGRMSIGE